MKTYKELEIEVLKNNNSIPASKIKYEVMKLQNFYKIKEYNLQYDYSETEYMGVKTEINIRCREHGEFKVSPKNLLRGGGCVICKENSDLAKLTKDFMEKVTKKYPRYDYSKVIYKNCKGKIEVICPNHGAFKVGVSPFLQNGNCPECLKEEARARYTKPFSEFLEKANKQFNNKYTYLEETYTKSTAKMVAVCPHHGNFKIIPNQHFKQMYGCIKCNPENAKGYRAYYYDKPTTLYYIKLIKGNEEYFKLGITTTTLDKRFITLRSEGLTYGILLT